LKAILEKCSIETTIRGEQLSIEQLAEISNNL